MSVYSVAVIFSIRMQLCSVSVIAEYLGKPWVLDNTFVIYYDDYHDPGIHYVFTFHPDNFSNFPMYLAGFISVCYSAIQYILAQHASQFASSY